ncbi:MAG: hypothetical protein K0S61_276 [Anaerocolumna sp.]|jgi:hypothetical protein|nr:hypothetical protein [Anaerocolumna sp.]
MKQRYYFREYLRLYKSGTAGDILKYVLSKADASFQVNDIFRQLRSVRKSLDMMVTSKEINKRNRIYYEL